MPWGGAVRLFPFDRSYGSDGNWRNHASRDQAFVLKVWREAQFGEALKRSLVFYMPPTDQYYTVVLEPERTEWELNEEAGIDPEGVLAVRCSRAEIMVDPETNIWKRTGSWTIHLKAIKGGLQFAPADAVYLNVAPETGYQDEIIYSSEADDQMEARDQHLYLTSQDGEVYASLIFDVMPFHSLKTCALRGKLKFTRNGSRRLAVPNSNRFGMDWFLKEQP